jgi:hypothetical protein
MKQRVFKSETVVDIASQRTTPRGSYQFNLPTHDDTKSCIWPPPGEVADQMRHVQRITNDRRRDQK